MNNAKPVAPDGSDVGEGQPFDGIDLSHAEVEIGIAIFDIEHRDMLARLQDLYLVIADDQPREQVQRVLSRLLDISKLHFAHEEQYMRDYRYPDASLHIDDHTALGASLEEFIADVLSDTKSVAQNKAAVRAFFKQWLLGHILEHDLALANFLVQKHIG